MLSGRWSRVWTLAESGSSFVTVASHVTCQDASFLISGRIREGDSMIKGMVWLGGHIQEVKNLDMADLSSISWKYHQSSWSKYILASILLLSFWVKPLFSLCWVSVGTACSCRLAFILASHYTSVPATLKDDCSCPLPLRDLHNLYTYHTDSNLDQSIPNLPSKFGVNLSTQIWTL